MQATAFIGFESPIARFFTRDFVGRCPEVILLDGKRYRAGDADRPITSAVGLVTWADLLRYSPDAATRMLLECIQSHDALSHVRFVALCLVPYASFVDAAHHDVQFVVGKTGSPSSTVDSVDAYARLLDPIGRAGYECRLAVSPMVLADDADESTGYPSLLQKLLRTARCLRDEVATKVPDYFSSYALRLRTGTGVDFNATTATRVSSWLLSLCANRWESGGPPVTFLESRLPVAVLAEQLRSTWDMELRPDDDPARFTALDDLFNELVWFDQDCDFRAVRYAVPTSAARALTADGLCDVAAHVAAAPCEPWECSYAPLRNRDLDNVAGLSRKDLNVEPLLSCQYHEGGSGETVLLLAPIGIDPGHLAVIATDLLRDHRVLVWRTGPQDGASVAGMRNVLRREGIDHGHLFTWCSGFIPAAMLTEESEFRVCSLTMVTPGMGDATETDAYKRLRWLVTQLKKRPSQDERIRAWSSLGFKQTASSDLDQYAPGTKGRRSPLQYHPVGYWDGQKAATGEPESSPAEIPRFINLCIDLAEHSNQNVDGFRERIVQYQGPVLVIIGTHDHLTHYPGASAICREQQRWTLATLLGGNHYFILEHGPAVATLVRRFVRQGSIVATADAVRGRRFRIEPARVGEISGDAPDRDVVWSSIS